MTEREMRDALQQLTDQVREAQRILLRIFLCQAAADLRASRLLDIFESSPHGVKGFFLRIGEILVALFLSKVLFG